MTGSEPRSDVTPQPRELHHLPLREHAGARGGLVLLVGQAIEHRPEIGAVRHRHVGSRAARRHRGGDEFPLVPRPAFFVRAGKGMERPLGQVRCRRHHRARIESPRQARAHLDVGAQPDTDRVGEQLLERAVPFGRPAAGAPVRIERPPAPHGEPVATHRERMSRRQLLEPDEERGAFVVHPIERHQIPNRRQARHDAIRLGERQCLGLRREREALRPHDIIKRLDPVSITRQKVDRPGRRG